MKYCLNCMYARIMYRDKDGYYCFCTKHKKEIGFYRKCEFHK